MPAIALNSIVRVVTGSKSLGLSKGAVCDVLAVQVLGAEYSHAVKVVLRPRRLGATDFYLYARHANRLSDATVKLNDGDPTRAVKVTCI